MSTVSSLYESLLNKTTSTTSTTTTTSSDSSSSINFLDLYLTELQYQDPTDPMDTKDMTQQLCSYSQLEQQQLTNTYLAQLIQSSDASQATQLIGKSAVVESNTLEKNDDSVSKIVLDLDQDYSDLTVSIYDENGSLVKSISEANLSSGQNTIQWDGTDNQGNEVADGQYTYKVSSSASSDSTSEITQSSSYNIVAVLNKSDGVYLLTEGGQQISYSEVEEVMQS